MLASFPYLGLCNPIALVLLLVLVLEVGASQSSMFIFGKVKKRQISAFKSAPGTTIVNAS